jgi:hypothetical protein
MQKKGPQNPCKCHDKQIAFDKKAAGHQSSGAKTSNSLVCAFDDHDKKATTKASQGISAAGRGN